MAVRFLRKNLVPNSLLVAHLPALLKDVVSGATGNNIHVIVVQPKLLCAIFVTRRAILRKLAD